MTGVLLTARKPAGDAAADQFDGGRRDEAEHADGDDPDEHVRLGQHGVGLPVAVADAEASGDHLSEDHADPRDADADRQPSEDAREDAGEHDSE